MALKKKSSKAPFRFVRPFWKKNWLPGLVLLALAFGIYLQSTSFEFVLDDQMVITENNFTKKGIKGIPDILHSEGFTGYFGEQKDLVAGSRYRPFSMIFFAVVYEYFGLNSVAFHLLNVVIYAFLCLLVFRVLHIYLPKYKSAHPLLSFPFIGALFYTLHPVHVECVANIKGLDEVLSMFGAMGCLYFTALFLDRKKYFWLVLSGLSFFVGLLSKETTITFMAIVPFCLYFFTLEKVKSYILTLLPLLIAFGIYIFLRVDAIGFLFSETLNIPDPMNNPFVDMTGGQKSATIMYTLGQYLRLLVFPLTLTHDYYPYHIPIMEWSDWQSILSLLGYIFIIGIGIYGFVKRNIIGFCIAYFIATLSIVSNIVFPIGTFMNERFLFMPSLGYCILLAYGLTYLLPKKMNRSSLSKIISAVLIAVISIAFLIRSQLRVPVWKNAYSLNSSAIKVSKNSARANVFMGTALYKKALDENDKVKKREMLEQVDAYMDKALSILPLYNNANTMKAGALGQLYNLDKDLKRLFTGFKEIASRRPDVSYLYEYLEFLNKRQRNTSELVDFYFDVGYNVLYLDPNTRNLKYAEKFFKYGEQLSPSDARINFALSLLYTTYNQQGKAQEHLTRAENSDPNIRAFFKKLQGK